MLAMLLMTANGTELAAAISDGDGPCTGGNNATGHDICACALDGNTIALSCAGGGTITGVVFAAIGTPTGICGTFARGKCDGVAARANATVTTACIGKTSCRLPCDIQHFNGGQDPCYGQVKHVAVQVTCSTIQPPAPPAPPTPAPPTPPKPPSGTSEVGCAVLPAGPPAILSCPPGTVITSIPFGSYGSPLGGCPNLLPNPACEDRNPAGWGANASFVVETLCLGLPSCEIPTDPMLYGSEFPCTSRGKQLGVTWRCSPRSGPPPPLRKSLWGGVGFDVWNFLFEQSHNSSWAIRGELVREVWQRHWATTNASFARMVHFDNWGGQDFSIDIVKPYLDFLQHETNTTLYWSQFHMTPPSSSCSFRQPSCVVTPAVQSWADDRAAFLDELVGKRGYSNIRWYCFSNELENNVRDAWVSCLRAALKFTIVLSRDDADSLLPMYRFR